MQAPPRTHDSTMVAVLKALPVSGRVRQSPPTSPFCEVSARSGALEHLDHGVGNLGSPHGRGIVALRLHVVRDASPVGDHPGNRPLEAVACRALTEMPEHE